MTYVVIITPEAQANITAAHEYIAEHSPANAAEWLDSLKERIDGLKEFPRRYGKAREQVHRVAEIRQFVHKSHRVVFTIDDIGEIVYVVYVRHAKMRAVGESEDADAVPGD